MRRVLVFAGVLFVGVLAAVPACAAAAGREVERDVDFRLDVEGFSVRVDVDNNDGDVNAAMVISRGPQVAYYWVPAEVTAERVTAQFGSLGQLDYRFSPKRNGSIECDGAEEGEATFEGSFVFTGENGYIQIDAPVAEGSFRIDPEPRNCPPGGLVRRVVPYSPTYSDVGATLGAKAGSLAQGREIEVYDDGETGPHRVFIFAALDEVREGMSVARGVQLAAKSSAFRWNFEKGTATLRPPAPFTGWAKFTRYGRKGHGTWKGSLGMPILGGDPVRLAGREFRAFVHRGVPQPR
jgi:hypothetical protein